jgi:[ribosomal protein S18]-alanine N-acetyltransferase
MGLSFFRSRETAVVPEIAPRLVPLAVATLDAVCDIEATAYPYPWTRGNFIDSMAAGYHCACLQDASGQVLGYLVAMDGVDETHLLNITVKGDARGRGHARAMLDALVRRSQTLRSEALWLEVRPSNRAARRLYAAYGFEEVGVRRGYYPDAGNAREDAVVMRLSLPPTLSGEDAHAVD